MINNQKPKPEFTVPRALPTDHTQAQEDEGVEGIGEEEDGRQYYETLRDVPGLIRSVEGGTVVEEVEELRIAEELQKGDVFFLVSEELPQQLFRLEILDETPNSQKAHVSFWELIGDNTWRYEADRDVYTGVNTQEQGFLFTTHLQHGDPLFVVGHGEAVEREDAQEHYQCNIAHIFKKCER